MLHTNELPFLTKDNSFKVVVYNWEWWQRQRKNYDVIGVQVSGQRVFADGSGITHFDPKFMMYL